jgi:hypothetical protein
MKRDAWRAERIEMARRCWEGSRAALIYTEAGTRAVRGRHVGRPTRDKSCRIFSAYFDLREAAGKQTNELNEWIRCHAKPPAFSRL